MVKYNKLCPGHDHFCWSHRHLMREDDLICTPDYKRLPKHLKDLCWKIKSSTVTLNNLSIVVDWLLEHPLDEDTKCTDRSADG